MDFNLKHRQIHVNHTITHHKQLQDVCACRAFEAMWRRRRTHWHWAEKRKAEVSVSEMEDRQTTFGCLSNGTAAKNEERSVQEIKKALGLLFNQLLKLLVQHYLQQTVKSCRAGAQHSSAVSGRAGSSLQSSRNTFFWHHYIAIKIWYWCIQRQLLLSSQSADGCPMDLRHKSVYPGFSRVTSLTWY